MKNFLPLLIILLGFNSLNAQNCYGDYPIYYASETLYIYQEMNVESAIEIEVPFGQKVKVISSFFGNSTGFWKICYKGKTGYTKKNQLSYEETNSATAKSNSNTVKKNNPISSYDVGFNPFLAQTTTSVNFRSNPSSNGTKLSTLPAKAIVYVYSNKSVNDYYKAIDVMTSTIGWVHKNYVEYIEDVDVSESGAFKSTGFILSYDSEVSIRNTSSYTIKIALEDDVFTLTPNSTKKIKIKPGRKYYIATAPGVIPASGYENFKSNSGYEWEFWVQTSRK